MLQNKDKIWMSDDEWVLKTKTNLIYIENILTKKVLGTTNECKVIPEDYEEGKSQQLWKKGEPNAEGYFTLENSNVTKIMTANYLNSSILQIKGNRTLKLFIGFLPYWFFFTYRSFKEWNINKNCWTFECHSRF